MADECQRIREFLVESDELPSELRRHANACEECAGAREVSRLLHGGRAREPRWAAGRCIDKYIIEERIGSGGQGVVFRARHEELQTRVVLKVVPLDVHSVSEAKLAAQIDHPNVCRVRDTLKHAPFRIIVMDYVEGTTLSERLPVRARRALPPLAALRIFKEVCDGVSAAHEAGILHLDLKPSNVLLREKTGAAVVTDFGLAGPPGTEARGGTVGHMAPEQQDGRPVDERTDVYSLGVLLATLLPDEEGELRAVMDRACAPEPVRRHRNVRELMIAVERAASKRLSRNVTVSLGAFAVIAVAAAGVWTVARRPRSVPSTAEASSALSVSSPVPLSPSTAPPSSSTAPAQIVDPARAASVETAVLPAAPAPAADASARRFTIDTQVCCAAVADVAKRLPGRINVLNALSACKALSSTAHASEVPTVVANNLGCMSYPPGCAPVDVPAACGGTTAPSVRCTRAQEAIDACQAECLMRNDFFDERLTACDEDCARKHLVAGCDLRVVPP